MKKILLTSFLTIMLITGCTNSPKENTVSQDGGNRTEQKGEESLKDGESNTEKKGDFTSEGQVQQGESRIQFEILGLDNRNNIQKVLGEEYESEWFKKLKLKLPLKEEAFLRVDYQDKTYLAISPGQVGALGHDLQIKRVYESDGVITILGEHITPTDLVELEIAYPTLYIAVKRTDKEVVVIWNQ